MTANHSNVGRWTFAPVIVALLIRLVLALTANLTADIANYRRVAEALNTGGHLYTATTGIYPYPPPWALVEQAAYALSQGIGGILAFWVILPTMLADVGIVYLLGRVAARRTMWAPWLYALSPVAVVITALHGQFDALPACFTLLALVLLQPPQRWACSALALAAGIALKSYPVLLVPFFLLRVRGWGRRIGFALLATLPTGLLLAPYLLRDFGAVRRELFDYRGVSDHGWAAFLRLSPGLFHGLFPQEHLSTLVTYSPRVFFMLYLLIFGWDLVRAASGRCATLASVIAVVYVSFYVAYGGLSSQYMVWALPFLLGTWPLFGMVYTATASLALFGFYSHAWPSILFPGFLAQLRPTGMANTLDWWRFGTLIWWAVNVAWLAFRAAAALLDGPRRHGVLMLRRTWKQSHA